MDTPVLRRIRLTQGKVALIDDSDLERVSLHRWYACKQNKGNQWYAHTMMVRDGRRTCVTLHRFILGFPESELDHRNGNGLDNRRRNLRFATRSQNGANKAKPKRSDGSTSKFKGVNFDNWSGKWLARICYNYTQINLGRFVCENDAAMAYRQAAKKYFGEYARFS